MANECRLCVSIGDVPVDEIIAILGEVEMAEIRIDLAGLDGDELKRVFRSHRGLIATCREGALNDEDRAVLLKKAVEYGAAMVDIEADADPVWRDRMIKFVRESDCRLILSQHWYLHTPGSDELRAIVDELFNLGADIVKVASMVNHHSDAAVLLGLYGDYSNLVAVGMGPLGVITRVASPFLGAPFTFASFGNNPATASGQVEYGKLAELIETISVNG